MMLTRNKQLNEEALEDMKEETPAMKEEAAKAKAESKRHEEELE